MSSYAAVHRRIASTSDPATRLAQALGSRVSKNAILGCALAAALTLLAFITKGGVELAGNTWAEILLTFLGVCLAVAVVLAGGTGRWWGVWSAGLFALLALLTALSIAWSVQPDMSWLEANRTLAYLSMFVIGIALARLFPTRWPALVGSIAVMATVLSAWALLVKVFPGALDRTDAIARLRAPFGYWNAVGLTAALGLPACLWAGSRRERGALGRALAPPALAILLSAILLSYSRSALIAAVLGIALWFALASTRLRGATALGIGAAGAAAISAWALSTSPLTQDGTPLAARSSAGHGLGVVLLVVLALVTAGGFLAAFLADRTTLSAQHRRRVGTSLIVAVALVPLVGVGALAASHRGLGGQISHFWSSVTNSSQFVGDRPGRLVKLGNTRSRYWSEAFKVGEHSLLGGAGAGAFGVARGRYSNDPAFVGHAHSYLPETFADLGLLGLGLSFALLAAWALATIRTVRPPPTHRQVPMSAGRAGMAPMSAERAGHLTMSAERTGMLTLLCVVVVFGVQSAIDWTWFVPGTTLPALVCAGWLAGRGPLGQRVGRRREHQPISSRPGAIAGLACAAVLLILAAWTVWQPLRASNSSSAAIAATGRGDTRAALADARAAASQNPLALDSLSALSAIYAALGDPAQARAKLVDGTKRQPQNAASWRALGLYDLHQRQAQIALSDLQRAQRLDPADYRTLTAINQAQSALRSSNSVSSR